MSLNPFAQIFDAKIIHPPLISKKKNKEKLKQIIFLYINFISGPDPRIHKIPTNQQTNKWVLQINKYSL